MKRLTQIFQALLGIATLILTTLVAAGRLAWRTIRNWWKRHSKWVCRSIATIFILISVCFVVLIAYAYYDSEYGRDYYDRRLSDNITLHSFSDNKWRVYDKQTEKYATDKINWLSEVSENDSLAVYALPNKRGYININNGKVVIDAKKNDYNRAWIFSEGLAAVVSDKKIGFINTNNEVVIPFKFDYPDEISTDVSFVFHNGYCTMCNTEGKVGIINTKGEWVLEPHFDQIWAPNIDKNRIVIAGGNFGLLDKNLNFKYPLEYDYIECSTPGSNYTLTQNGRMWQEDCNGNVVHSFMFEYSKLLHFPVDLGTDENGYTYTLSDYAAYYICGKYGIMNRTTGKPLTLAIYDSVDMISPTLFQVDTSQSSGIFLVNTNGDTIEL